MTTVATCDVDFPQKEGQKVMWFKNIHVDFTVGDMRIHLNNLFNGNKVLGKCQVPAAQTKQNKKRNKKHSTAKDPL